MMVQAQTVHIRLLTRDDAAAYQAVRLRALQESPDAFTVSYSEEVDQPLTHFAAMLEIAPTFGAFVGGKLVGLIGVSIGRWLKLRHRATIIRVYVAPELRGQGIARRLLDAALDYARQQPQIEILDLEVTVGNEVARRMYAEAGFVSCGVNRRAFKIDDQYYDVEMMALDLKRDSR